MILRVDILAMVLNSKTCGHFHTGHRAGLLSLRRLPACEWSGEERNAAPAPGVGGRERGRRRSAAAVPADAAVPKQTHRGLPLLYNVKAGETFTLHS